MHEADRLVIAGYEVPLQQRTPADPARYPDGPGALLMRLIANRNLGLRSAAATFLLVTGRYWSATTYRAIGDGRKALTLDLVVDFATVLGISAGVLAALTGFELADAPRQPVDAAELIWAARRLTATQVRQVVSFADHGCASSPSGG